MSLARVQQSNVIIILPAKYFPALILLISYMATTGTTEATVTTGTTGTTCATTAIKAKIHYDFLSFIYFLSFSLWTLSLFLLFFLALRPAARRLGDLARWLPPDTACSGLYFLLLLFAII